MMRSFWGVALTIGIVSYSFPLKVYSNSGPPEFYIDKGACPGECCQYGEWKVIETTKALSFPREDSMQVGEFTAGMEVIALTGEVHTIPGKFMVKKEHGKYKPGDIIWVYTYLGETFFKIWYEGQWGEEPLGFSIYGGSAGKRCASSVKCWGVLDKELDSTWWIQIKSPDGWVGWTHQGDNFRGKDACG